MKGKILDYSIKDSKGIISAEDGNRYEFVNAEWKSEKAPKVKQSVDFVINESNATGIYLDSESRFDKDEALETAKEAFGDAKEKFDDLKNSSTVADMMSKKNEIFKKGAQNKYGFTLSILLFFAYFLPVIRVPFGGNASMWEGDLGFWVASGLLILASFFYIGVKHILVRLLSGVVLMMLFLQYMDLFSGLRDFGGFELLQFGSLVIIPLAILLGFAGLFKGVISKEA